MNKYDFDNFDKNFDHASLVSDYEKAKKNEFADVPFGKYEVYVHKMELVLSKKGDPMLTIWFKICAGPLKNSIVFYNQVVTTGIGLHSANEMMRQLAPNRNVEWVGNYRKYSEMIEEVFEDISKKYEYAISYEETAKGYTKINVDEVFELES